MRLFAALCLALCACKEPAPPAAAPAPKPPPADPAAACADGWLAERKLNEFGDAPGTMYTGGTPLFDEKTGQRKDRLAHLFAKHAELRAKCTGREDGG